MARGGIAETLEIPRAASASSCRTSAAGSAASATSTSRATSPRSPAPPGDRSACVFSRREEFVAPDKVRHAIVVDLETGDDQATARSLARRGAAPLDCGAYAARQPRSSTEIAAMMVGRPVPHPERRHRGAHASTRTGPGGLRRARRPDRRPAGRSSSTPTCWPRASASTRSSSAGATSSHDGDEGPTRPASSSAIGAARVPRARRARHRPASRSRADDEAIGVACGWWFRRPRPVGRLRQDRSPTAPARSSPARRRTAPAR